MKFTLSWLKEHLDTDADVAAVADAMTMAGLEVEEVHDPIAALAPFTVARIVSAEPHPNADRLRVCQVDTVDGPKEIVCGAPNARAGLTTIYAPIGAFVPGLGVTLVEKPVRGVVSNGMLCSAAELELAGESDGILELADDLAVGTPAAGVFGAEPVIDFEVTPNRPDWLGVAGIARDLAAASLGQLTTPSIQPVPGTFPSPITVRIDAPEMCPVFAGRLIRGVKNGPSPEWLQRRLTAIGLRSINRLVDVTNLVAYDRCRPLHVYDAAKLVGSEIVVRAGQVAPAAGEAEQLIALDGKTYGVDPTMCLIADQGGERAIGLGGVMGGVSTGCSDETTDVFIECAWFDPILTAQTGRTLSLNSDAQYRFARGVDPASVLPGLELATRLILDLCGGEPSDLV
ncbi:MAG: YtpR family tRNA-binding protein, partial [bacterium]